MGANSAPQGILKSFERTSSFVSKSEYPRKGWSIIEEQTDIVTPTCWKQRVLVHSDLKCPSEHIIQRKYIKLELLNSGSIAQNKGPWVALNSDRERLKDRYIIPADTYYWI